MNRAANTHSSIGSEHVRHSAFIRHRKLFSALRQNPPPFSPTQLGEHEKPRVPPEYVFSQQMVRMQVSQRLCIGRRWGMSNGHANWHDWNQPCRLRKPLDCFCAKAGLDQSGPLLIFAILAVGFPALAWLLTRRSEPLPFLKSRNRELSALCSPFGWWRGLVADLGNRFPQEWQCRTSLQGSAHG